MFSAGDSLRVRELPTAHWELDREGCSAHSSPRIVEIQESKTPSIFPLPELLHSALSLELIKEGFEKGAVVLCSFLKKMLMCLVNPIPTLPPPPEAFGHSPRLEDSRLEVSESQDQK